MTKTHTMEISVMYPAAGRRPRRHTMRRLLEHIFFEIVKGRRMERERKNHFTLGILPLDNHYDRVTCIFHLEIPITLNVGLDACSPGEIRKQGFIRAAIIEEFI